VSPAPRPPPASRRAWLLALLAGAVAAPPARAWPWQRPSAAGRLQALAEAGPWLNTPTGLAPGWPGPLLLVNVWTYSCINCLRALPHLRAWHANYQARGLSVVGVHCPEFAFEHDPDNVRAALVAQGVAYPVACDNDFALWRAFDNRYWPSFYLLDSQGRIRHTQSGEGRYADMERMIRQLLAESGGLAALPQSLAPVTAPGVQAPALVAEVRVGETYLGHARAQGLASPGGFAKGQSARYSVATLRLGAWGLTGQWTALPEQVRSDGDDGVISLRFHARDVHLVMGPAARGGVCRFQVSLDGQAPGADHGIDVSAEGFGEARAARLYGLVRQAGAVQERTLRIRFLDAGVMAYAFSFG
jgi:thiol-disulfide isomerase/thioredoxin